MQKSKIEWTDTTWNPMSGCSSASAGCLNCYARRQAERLQRMHASGYENGFAVTLHPERLEQPARWVKKRRVFVCSMGDLFHEKVPDDFIVKVYEAMIAASNHEFMVLTKRPERMVEFSQQFMDGTGPVPFEKTGHIAHGVTVESAEQIERWQILAARVESWYKFVSFEPLIGNIFERKASKRFFINLANEIDMMIIGGESGPGARRMNTKWASDLVALGKHTKTAVFVKQMGSAWARETSSTTRKGNDPSEWLPELRFRQHMFDGW